MKYYVTKIYRTYRGSSLVCGYIVYNTLKILKVLAHFPYPVHEMMHTSSNTMRAAMYKLNTVYCPSFRSRLKRVEVGETHFVEGSERNI